MNQARSPFAQAVLERNFPEDHISSTGVVAVGGYSVPDAVRETASRWGVPITQIQSRALSDVAPEIMSADLVITAEKSQINAIRNLGYKGLLRNYEEIIEDLDFIPMDPVGLFPDAMSRELGKVGALTLRAAIEAKGFEQIVAIAKKLGEIEDKTKLKAELDKLPKKYHAHPAICAIRNTNFIKEESSGKDLVYFCGYTEEVWNPQTMC